MPKAEVGSNKHLANKMKSKGLQRLRWYCQICNKQCRDENGFKQHTQSEGHVRAMLLVGEDPRKYIDDFSRQFLRDFTTLLKTSHGEKKVSLNGFYQEYIHDKEHVHMNSTKWGSLTEFAKHLGKEGICRVEEGDRGIEVAFIDDSPEAVRRREDVKRKDKLAKGDEDQEARLLERQIKAAKEEAAKRGVVEEKERRESGDVTVEPIKVSMSLGGKKTAEKRAGDAKEIPPNGPVEITTFSSADAAAQPSSSTAADTDAALDDDEEVESAPTSTSAAPKVSLALGAKKPKYVNPFTAKKSSNPLSKKKDGVSPVVPEKKMSNAERIMREELERKRKADERAATSSKKQRT